MHHRYRPLIVSTWQKLQRAKRNPRKLDRRTHVSRWGIKVRLPVETLEEWRSLATPVIGEARSVEVR